MNSNNIPLVLNSLSNTTTIEQSIGASITNTTTNTTTYVYTALTISNFISLVASLSVMSIVYYFIFSKYRKKMLLIDM